MSTTLRLYQVARDGKIIGAYTMNELVAEIDAGAVRLDDHYLTEGMGEWRLLSGLSLAIEEARTTLAAQAKMAEGQAAFAKSQHAKYTASWMGNLPPPSQAARSSQAGASKPLEPVAGAYPQPSGLKRGVLYILISGPLAVLCALILTGIYAMSGGGALGSIIVFILGVLSWLGFILLVLHGFANINAYSIEMALQRFDQYRRRDRPGT